MGSQIDNQIIVVVDSFDPDYDFRAEYEQIKPKLEQLLEANPSFPASLPLHRCLASICDVTDQWKKGFSYVSKTLDEVKAQEAILRTHGNDPFLMRNLVRLYDVTGKLYYRIGLYGDAKSFFGQAINTAIDVGYRSALLDLHSNLIRTRYNEWKWAKEYESEERRTRSLDEFGRDYQAQIDSFRQHCDEFNGFELKEFKRGLASIYHNYAILLWTERGRSNDSFYEEGLKLHDLAEQLNRELDDNYRLNQTLMNKGLLGFARWQKTNEAEDFFKADHFFKQVLDRRQYWPRAVLWVYQKRAEYAYKKGEIAEGESLIKQLEATHQEYVNKGSEEDLATLWWTYPMVRQYKPDDEETRNKFIDVGVRLRNELSFFHYRRLFQRRLAEALQERALSYIDQASNAIEALDGAYNRELVDLLLFRRETLPMLQEAEREDPNLFQEVNKSLDELHQNLEVKAWIEEKIEEARERYATEAKPTTVFADLIKEKAGRHKPNEISLEDYEKVVEQEARKFFNQAYMAYERIGGLLDLKALPGRVGKSIPPASIDYPNLLESGEAAILYYLSKHRSVAFMIKRGCTPIAVPLDGIDDETLSTLNHFNRHPQESYQIHPELQRDMYLLKMMYSLLVKPLEQELQGIHRLYFLPSPLVIHSQQGKPETQLITNLPTHAFYDGRKFLLERYEIVNLLSLEAFSIKKCRHAEPQGKRVLIIGRTTEDLPENIAKVCQDIKAKFKEARLEPIFLDDQTANRQQVIDLLAQGGFKYILFYIHGLTHPEHPLLSSLLLQNGNFLTASDILFKAHLDGAVVLLIACESGENYTAGSENLGMTRAFLAAGAEVVIGGMGQVNAEVAGELLGRFYQTLLTNETEEHDVIRVWKQACLKQLEPLTRDEQKFPANWSPFVVYV